MTYDVNTGDEQKHGSDVGDASETIITYGKRKKSKVTKKVLKTDIVRGYANRKVTASCVC